MKTPKISILIPTYNYARYLPEALDSILRQDRTDFEVIISDDASSDDTAEIVAPYTASDPRFHFHRQQKNLGMVANWNWCLQQARGDYIQYLFADDFFIHSSALSCLAAQLDENPRAGLAVAARRLADDTSRLDITAEDLRRAGIHDGRDAIRRCLLSGKNLIGEPSVVMFRKALASRGFDDRYKQLVDLEMWFHLCNQAMLAFIAKPLCAFRQHVDQQTAVNAQDESTRLEMFHLFQTYQHATGRDETGIAARLTYYTTLYAIIKGLRRSPLASPELDEATRYLQGLIPQIWLPLAALSYRIRKQSASLIRSIYKRKTRSGAMRRPDR